MSLEKMLRILPYSRLIVSNWKLDPRLCRHAHHRYSLEEAHRRAHKCSETGSILSITECIDDPSEHTSCHEAPDCIGWRSRPIEGRLTERSEYLSSCQQPESCARLVFRRLPGPLCGDLHRMPKDICLRDAPSQINGSSKFASCN